MIFTQNKILKSILLMAAFLLLQTSNTLAVSSSWSYAISYGSDYATCLATTWTSNQTCTGYDPQTNTSTGCSIIPTNPSSYIWVLRSVSVMVNDNEVTTEHYEQCDPNSYGPIYGPTAGTFTAATSKNSYSPGESIPITLTATDNASGNCSDFGLFGCSGGHGMRVSATLNGTTVTNNQTANWSSPQSFTAPATPGPYMISLDGGWYDTSNFTAQSSMTIDVVGTPTVNVNIGFIDRVKSSIKETFTYIKSLDLTEKVFAYSLK